MKQKERKENVWLGIIGAFLFSLGGGIVYALLMYTDYISSISALIGAALSIYGYGLFSGRHASTRGVVAAAVSTVIVMCVTLLLCWAYEFYDYVYQDYTYITFGQAVKDVVNYMLDDSYPLEYGLYIYTLDVSAFVRDLVCTLIFTAIGLVTFIRGYRKREPVSKADAAAPVASGSSAEPAALSDPAEFDEPAAPAEPSSDASEDAEEQ